MHHKLLYCGSKLLLFNTLVESFSFEQPVYRTYSIDDVVDDIGFTKYIKVFWENK